MNAILTPGWRRAGLLTLLLTAWSASSHAAAFDSGSDGSYGAINVAISTTVTLDLPPDGVFRCTTINVGSSATLRFNRNPLNTPVVLLATGDVVVSGIITVAGGDQSGALPGKGGPGGFDGGYGGGGPAAPASRGGEGHGPGRGINATGQRPGVHAVAVGANDRTYGNVLLVPLVGGSGGSGTDGNPGWGGGGGGGAILIASNTRITVNGRIDASGGSAINAGLGGSGGGIRLVAPTGGGSGQLDARGGNGGGGDGRVRVDCTAADAFRNLSFYGAFTRGNRMFVFPPATPKLHIVEAAGQAIPVGAGAAITIELPAGSAATQNVKVRGEGFTGMVPVQIVVTPEHSAATVYDVTLNSAQSPSEATAAVTLPAGQPTTIEAWVR